MPAKKKEQNRIESKKLQKDVKEATVLIAKAMKILAPYDPALTDDERQSVTRGRSRFAEKVPELIAALADHPDVARTSGFSAAAVEEDLANVQTLAPLVVKAQQLARAVADAELVWTSEAFTMSTAAYRVARALAGVQPSLRPVVDSLAPVFVLEPRRQK